MDAVIYLRVSGLGQVDGDGFPRQREKAHDYAAKTGLTIVGEYRDEGVSGKLELEGRKGLAALMDCVTSSDVRIVLVERSERIARDLVVGEVILENFRQNGVKVIECDNGTELTAIDGNPTAVLMRQILGAFAQYDRTITVLKLRAARDRMRRKHGHCEGPKPFGKNPKYPEERRTLQRMLELRDSGLLLIEVAEQLNNEGRLRRNGEPWTDKLLSRTLQRVRKTGDASPV